MKYDKKSVKRMVRRCCKIDANIRKKAKIGAVDDIFHHIAQNLHDSNKQNIVILQKISTNKY